MRIKFWLKIVLLIICMGFNLFIFGKLMSNHATQKCIYGAAKEAQKRGATVGTSSIQFCIDTF